MQARGCNETAPHPSAAMSFYNFNKETRQPITSNEAMRRHRQSLWNRLHPAPKASPRADDPGAGSPSEYDDKDSDSAEDSTGLGSLLHTYPRPKPRRKSEPPSPPALRARSESHSARSTDGEDDVTALPPFQTTKAPSTDEIYRAGTPRIEKQRRKRLQKRPPQHERTVPDSEPRLHPRAHVDQGWWHQSTDTPIKRLLVGLVAVVVGFPACLLTRHSARTES